MNIDNIINSLSPHQNRGSGLNRSRQSSRNSGKSKKSATPQLNQIGYNAGTTNKNQLSGNNSMLNSPKDIMLKKIDKNTTPDIRKKEQNILQEEWDQKNIIMQQMSNMQQKMISKETR